MPCLYGWAKAVTRGAFPWCVSLPLEMLIPTLIGS
jgi:hypothetical protein